jgi:pre-rRNA-processing protein IPI3
VSAQVSKNALDVWGLDKESALHKFFVGEPMGVVASSPDGAFFAAGSLTGAAYLWEVSTGKLVRTWPAHFKAVSRNRVQQRLVRAGHRRRRHGG